jgi:hypothetical protein
MVAERRAAWSLDLLIGEARRRMLRRRVLAAVVLLAGLAVGLTFAFRSPGGGPSGSLSTTGYSQPTRT